MGVCVGGEVKHTGRGSPDWLARLGGSTKSAAPGAAV